MDKIGVFSDIHGDLVAFETAMRVFNAHGVTQWWCAGDTADHRGEVDQIVASLIERNAVNVSGNHDRAITEINAKDQRRLARLGRALKEETRAYLRALPPYVILTQAETRVLIAHGIPTSDTTGLFPDAPIELFDHLAAVYAVDLMILGHTHAPMQLITERITTLNPGSVVGTLRRDSHTCAILSLPDRTFTLFDLTTEQPQELAVIRK